MQNKSWFWARGYWKFYIADIHTKQKIEKWKRAKLHCRYFFPDGRRAYDFIVPSGLYNKVAKLLNMPSLKRSPKRVEAGKKVGRLRKTCRFTQANYSEMGQVATKDTFNSSLPV